MSYPLAKRSLCTLSSLLCPLGTTGACRGRRMLHKSVKGKAVMAVAPELTIAQQYAPPPIFLQPDFTSRCTESTQLNIRDNFYKPAFYQAVAQIMKLREEYIQDRAIFIRATDMLPLLLGLGAREEDVAKLALLSDSLEDDPTLPFRKARNCRFCLDFDTNSVRRLEFQPFMLSAEEDFKRHDSGKIRHFEEIQNDLQLNSIFQALLVFKAIMVNGMKIAHRPNLQYSANKWVCTLFNLRTITTPDILGEPALEGVHSDGVDHTMTTFLGASNMTSNSAATFMHSMKEKTGISLYETSPHNLLARVRHSTLLDTLLVVDHERKHSLSAVYPADKTKEATRDMLIFFTRRPVKKTHTSALIDSLAPHPTLSMEIPLFVPDRT